MYLLQLACYPVAVVILHVNKHEIGRCRYCRYCSVIYGIKI